MSSSALEEELTTEYEDWTNLFLPRTAQILKSTPLTATDTLHRLRFQNGDIGDYKPGQFVMVSMLGIGEVPISICSSPTHIGGFELCVRSAGTVTQAINELNAGALVPIRGPYGRGFSTEKMVGHDVMIIAGGIGLAPMRSLIQYLLDQRSQYGEIWILFGAKRPGEVLFQDEVLSWSSRPDIHFLMTVDIANRAWRGNVGPVTSLFHYVKVDPHNTCAAVCGPPVMYRPVLRELQHLELPDAQMFFSFERRMKCGLGKCGHCLINGHYCCKEGPVLSYAEIRELPEAM